MLDYLNELNFVAAKDGGIFYSSKKNGIFPLFDCLMKNKKDMEDAEIADKIVGIGAARLMVYAKVDSVAAKIITHDALALFAKNNILVRYEKSVDKIINRDGTDICPIEKLSVKYKKIDEFIDMVAKFLNYKY